MAPHPAWSRCLRLLARSGSLRRLRRPARLQRLAPPSLTRPPPPLSLGCLLLGATPSSTSSRRRRLPAPPRPARTPGFAACRRPPTPSDPRFPGPAAPCLELAPMESPPLATSLAYSPAPSAAPWLTSAPPGPVLSLLVDPAPAPARRHLAPIWPLSHGVAWRPAPPLGSAHPAHRARLGLRPPALRTRPTSLTVPGFPPATAPAPAPVPKPVLPSPPVAVDAAAVLLAVGVPPADLQRAAGMCPELLSVPMETITAALRFLTEEAGVPAESELNTNNSSGLFAIVFTGRMSVKYLGVNHHGHDVGAVQANHPAPMRRTVYYFEMTVRNAEHKGHTSFGFTTESFKMQHQPGWDSNSCGYHGDDGYLYRGAGKGESFGPKFTSGDTIGAGINYLSQEFFFMKNVSLVGAFPKDTKGPLYPTIAVHIQDEELCSLYQHSSRV